MHIKDLKNILLGSAEEAEKPSTAITQALPEAIPAIPADAIIIVPMQGTVLFPQNVLPLVIRRKSSVSAVQEAVRSEKSIGLLMQLRDKDEEPSADDLHPVGTVAEILRYITVADDTHHVVCQGVQRFRVLAFLPGYPFLVARIECFEEPEVSSKGIEAHIITLKQTALDVLAQTRQAPSELVNAIQSITAPALLADLVGSYLIVKSEEKQAILALFDIQERIDKLLELLNYRPKS